MINETSFYAILPDAPTWDDLPLAIDPVSDDNELRTDALRDSFKCFQRGPAHNLQRQMLSGNATPAMLRDAVRRLNTMLMIAGETGDYRTEAEIVNSLNTLCLVASKTLYR
ncbi:TPA: hypothetical protein ACT5B2_001843 [Burkholderia cenocepacia]